MKLQRFCSIIFRQGLESPTKKTQRNNFDIYFLLLLKISIYLHRSYYSKHFFPLRSNSLVISVVLPYPSRRAILLPTSLSKLLAIPDKKKKTMNFFEPYPSLNLSSSLHQWPTHCKYKIYYHCKSSGVRAPCLIFSINKKTALLSYKAFVNTESVEVNNPFLSPLLRSVHFYPALYKTSRDNVKRYITDIILIIKCSNASLSFKLFAIEGFRCRISMTSSF
ncbi:hypothetical protein V1478_008749 [Vespula squamosa]|uniref:Uncharacterized protein n=1 Tax=Vespula squamosa TaxID=30214 RepID=A0ABD2AV26_VESSQ